ncbi:ABC transporter substrate-binding protein [Streptomyces monticola]|uniref:ABC transporter substrate-binding protein n=1 Tax=Streptomyces monticola TaxID=2666263 RepID=A0ABW2JLR8_9ACTN
MAHTRVGTAVQRRITGLTAAGAALGMTAVLAGCGAGGGSGDVTLKMVAADYGDSSANSSQKYWDKLAGEFEKKNPGIKVDVDVYSWSDVDAKVADMVKKGQAPDIAQIGAYAGYAAQGKLYSADDLLSIPVQADFLPSLTEAGEVRRTQYGMPFASSTRLLFYNKELFEKAGITGTPQSWGELAQDAELLKEQGVKYPFALPLGREEAPAETLMWLLSGGDGYTDNVGTYTLDSDQNIDTFTWLKDDLVGKGLTGPTAPGDLNRQEAFNAFSRGEVGMLNGHPTLMKQAAKKGVKYGMVPLPGVNGNAKATMGVADWMMGFKQNGHREQIGKFLDFVYSEKNVLDFSERYDILPVTSTASDAMADDPAYKHLREFLEELPTSQLYPVGKTSWAQVSASIKQDIGKAVAPHGNPASILKELQNKAASAEAAE